MKYHQQQQSFFLEKKRICTNQEMIQTVVDETIDASLNEGQLTKEELIAQKQKESLAKRRSFLVRMVSDPKCYNPKIVRHLNMANHRKMSQDLYRDRTLMQVLFGSFKKVAQLFCTSSGKQSPIASVPVGCLSPPGLAALVSCFTAFS
ncbi:hypothetical protein ANCCEY_13320 [Ancylostoma ceylanicum]|uniref:Uncharacterized protein n=1 Tax=Ancylostoma ceylanicum TaxID=53326 RepID=A0A0D6LIZ0_9BILA|nr:hypothetical protein ANCCEY_13320 [Ancylostoma ceylanicum]